MSPLSSEWIPLLKKVFFFTSFSEEELGGILNLMQVVSLPKGAVLFRQGDPGDALYIIHSGRVRLMVTEHGQEHAAAYLGRGESLGEMTLLTGEPRPNTAVVDATAELLMLYRKDFEPLLKTMPSMAVHISRILSHRLVESSRPAPSGEFKPRIVPLITQLPLDEAVVFTVNLAVSLVEQTRRKVLVLDIMDHDQGVYAKALGLHPVRVGESNLRQEDLQSPAVVQKLTVFHPSGLELMSLPFSLMEGKLFSSLYPFLSLLRKNYDITLLVLPPRLTAVARAILEETDQLLYIEREALSRDDVTTLTSLSEFLPAEKVLHVPLSEGEAGPRAAPGARIPWNPNFGRMAQERGTPFLLADAPATQRALDRLARRIAGLRIGLAMGSGAAYGYTLIGMLRVMERHGVYPDIIAGTSMGALIGSFYAAGKTPDELEQIALSITKKKLLSMADFTLPWQGVLIGRGILKFLKSVLGDVTFEDLQVPFTCVATDIVTGQEVILRQGKVAEAVRGSLSLPFFFQPFFHEGRFLVDGGLVNPVPSSVIAAMGADVLISVNLTSKPSSKRMGRRDWRRLSSSYWKGPNILEVLMKTIYTMQFEIAQARANLSHVVLAPDLSDYTWAEFYRAADIIRLGEDYMEEMMPKVKSTLPFFADYCRVPARPAPHTLGY
jgi:NTE family protein